MSRIYAQQKRPGAQAAEPSYRAPAVHAPSLVSGQSSGDLDALMQAKYRQHFLDNQIPTAEAEADRIAASVSGARTPEEVKSQLGEKMGADFSSVTFHTDSAALKQADAMGARAYTSGSDVYFGQGGFDPGVAAHELVHTVQQGMVGSTMATTSAPTGGVQMKPSLLNRLRIHRLEHQMKKDHLRWHRDSIREAIQGVSDEDRASALKDLYNDESYSVPARPEQPWYADPRGNLQQQQAHAAYQQQLADYDANVSAIENAATKNRNDVYGFRNHWWQFWRAKKGDFASAAKKFR